MLRGCRSIWYSLMLVVFFTFSTGECLYSQHVHSKKRFTNWLKEDPVTLVTTFSPKHLLFIGIGVMGIAALSPLDDPASIRFYKRNQHSAYFKFADRFGEVNLVLPFSAIVFGSSLFTEKSKFQNAAFTSLQSVVMTTIAINSTKFIVGRSRPLDNDGSYDFDFFHLRDTSFPSSHTATAFACMLPWVLYYPHLYTYTLLVIPASTGLARISNGKHWITDVVAGSAIGIAISYYLTKRHLNVTDHKIQFYPTIGSGLYTFTANITIR